MGPTSTKIKYNVGDRVRIVNNTTNGFPEGIEATLTTRVTSKDTWNLISDDRRIMWHPESDFILVSAHVKPPTNPNDVCYLCKSKDIYNTDHCDNEKPLCEKHYDYIDDYHTLSRSSTKDVTGSAEKGIIKSNRTWGIELESHAPSPVNMRIAIAQLPTKWYYCGDGTIGHAYGQELKTNPMKGLKGENILTEYLNKITSELGWGVTPTCGTHIHIGVPEYKGDKPEDKIALRNLVLMYTIFDPVIRCLIPPERRVCRYAVPLRQTHIGIDHKTHDIIDEQKKMIDVDYINHCTSDKALMQTRKQNEGAHKFSKYYGINFSHLKHLGTVEIRYHEGSLDPVRLIHWIALHSAIIDMCLINKMPEKDIIKFAKITDIQELLDKMLQLLSSLLDPSTIEYTKERFNTYLKENLKSKYIQETRYTGKNDVQYDIPANAYEQARIERINKTNEY